MFEDDRSELETLLLRFGVARLELVTAFKHGGGLAA